MKYDSRVTRRRTSRRRRGLRRTFRRAWLQVTIAALALVVTVGLVTAALIQSQPTTSNQASDYVPPPVAGTEHIPTFAVLGDSFAEASQVEPADRYPRIVAEALNWRLDNRSQGGTGYLANGPAEFPERGPFTERVDALIRSAPDYVLVAGGINDTDRDYSSEEVSAAVAATLGNLRDGLPESQIIALGPMWPDGRPNASALAIRDVIRDQAASLNLPYIETLDDPWITGSRDGTVEGNRADYIGSDGTHPTAAGQAYIADRVLQEFAALGITAYTGPPLVAFLGDSYTYGEGASGISGRWSSLLSDDLGWDERNFGEAMTGYATAGPAENNRTAYTGRVQEIIDLAPNIVVVSGGQNDLKNEIAPAETAVSELYRALRSGLPDARIIAVGPSTPWDVDERLLALDGAVQKAAAEIGAEYVNMHEPAFFTTPDLFSEDRQHPSPAGHVAYAERIRAAVE